MPLSVRRSECSVNNSYNAAASVGQINSLLAIFSGTVNGLVIVSRPVSLIALFLYVVVYVGVYDVL